MVIMCIMCIMSDYIARMSKNKKRRFHKISLFEECDAGYSFFISSRLLGLLAVNRANQSRLYFNYNYSLFVFEPLPQVIQSKQSFRDKLTNFIKKIW